VGAAASTTNPSPLVRLPDLRRLAALGAGAAASAVWPRRWDRGLLRAWERAYLSLGGRAVTRVAERMRRRLPPDAASADPRALAEEHVSARIEDMWGRVRGLGARGYDIAIEVEGLEHVHAALERGRGVVIWCMRVGSATVIKMAFARSGLPLHHLSRVEHGSPTTSRVGVRWVAPLYRRVEDRVLAERIQIPLDGSLAYLDAIAERLAANRCVSIFGEHAGRQSVEVETLGVRRRFALGAPSVAWRSGAGLVTAYALREGPFRHRLVVEEELPVDRAVARKTFAQAAVREFARRLEACVIRHPADWQAWFYLAER
jgi:lauroyl/myristoyl acyltransferase